MTNELVFHPGSSFAGNFSGRTTGDTSFVSSLARSRLPTLQLGGACVEASAACERMRSRMDYELPLLWSWGCSRLPPAARETATELESFSRRYCFAEFSIASADSTSMLALARALSASFPNIPTASGLLCPTSLRFRRPRSYVVSVCAVSGLVVEVAPYFHMCDSGMHVSLHDPPPMVISVACLREPKHYAWSTPPIIEGSHAAKCSSLCLPFDSAESAVDLRGYCCSCRHSQSTRGGAIDQALRIMDIVNTSISSGSECYPAAGPAVAALACVASSR